MIILGIVLIVLGLVLPVSFAYVLLWLGVALLVVGLVFLLLASTGRSHRHYW